MPRASSDQRSAGGRNAPRPLHVGARVTVRGPFWSDDVVMAGTVAVLSRGGKVAVIKGASGRRVFRYTPGGWVDLLGIEGYQIGQDAHDAGPESAGR